MRKLNQYVATRRAAMKSGLGLCLFALGPMAAAAEPAPGAKLQATPVKRANDNRATVIRVLEEAMRTTNMKAAVAQYGGALSPEEKSMLLGITPAELAHLKSARAKLKTGLK